LKSKIVNMVSTADLKQSVELALLNKEPWGRYDLDVYPAGYIKDGWIQGKVIVFHSGKLISVGTTTIKASIQDLNHAKDLLLSARMTEEILLKPQIRNIVVTADFGKQLRLERVSSALELTIYEPEQFPGVIWHPRDQPVSILVFASGKLVIAGLKSLQQYRMIQSYLDDKLSLFS
jgi:transcription initiation factor TFIID TATA-box-binding protein